MDRPRSTSRARRLGLLAAVVAACALLALTGIVLGLRIATPGEYDTTLGSVSLHVKPSAHGEIDAYVPLADWGARIRAFSAPISIQVEPRGVDRDAVLRAATGDRALLADAEDDLRDAVHAAVLRTLRFAIAGAALLAAMLGVTLAAFNRRRLVWVLGAPLLVMAIAAAISGVTIVRASTTFDARAIDHPTFYARGAELVQLLDAAENARRAGDGYASKVQAAVGGFASLLAAPSDGLVSSDRRALVASDLHDNRPALGALADYARDKPVYFVGDFGTTGSTTEARLLAPAVAGLGETVVAVSGNHDSRRFMRALARRGVTVLTRRGVLRGDGSFGPRLVRVDGALVAGFDDPLESRRGRAGAPERIFSFSEVPDPEAAQARADADVMRWFDALPRRPDVVLIHQNGLAQRFARTLHERGDDRPLTVLTGHDHRQHVTSYGGATVVDAGTVGASGIYGVGRDYVGLGDLHFDTASEVSAVDLIAVEPVTGAAEARRVVVGDCADVCRRFPRSDDDLGDIEPDAVSEPDPETG